MKVKIILSIIISAILLFLGVYMNGVYWLYLDNSGFPITDTKYINVLIATFYSLAGSTSFGYDMSSLISSRFIGHVFLGIGDFVLYFIFLLVAFVSSYKILRIYFSRIASFSGALLYTINPVSLLFLNLTGFIFAYAALPIIVLSTYLIYQKKKYLYVILLVLGLYFLISYARILGIYGVLLVLLGFWYRKEILGFFYKNILFSVTSMIMIGLSLSPFVFSIIYPSIDGQGEYFSGLGNYAESGFSASKAMYMGIQNMFFGEKIVLRELTANFAGEFQDSFIFIAYSFIFLLGIFIYSFFLRKNQLNSLKVYLIFIALFTIFAIAGPKFIPEEVFSKIAYKYFPFIANNTNWLYIVVIPILAFLLSYSIEYSRRRNVKYGVVFLGIIYTLICIYPILNSQSNPRLHTMSISDIPINYRNTFHQEVSERNPSLFFPATQLYFTWSPYPFDVTNNTLYQSLFTNNVRLVNSKQAKLVDSLTNSYRELFVANNSIFNLKNIFVFKNIRNINNGQFDYYSTIDYIAQSERAFDNFLLNTSLYIKQDNDSFTQFGILNDDKYEYFLYSPGIIARRDMVSFFSGELDISQKPIVIDPDSFHKPIIVDNYEIPVENQNIAIRYKNSISDTTKIFAKIANFDSSKPFLLQLNQTFGMSWKVKWITKEQFDTKQCIDEYKEYSITQNKVCQFDAKLLDLSDVQYLGSPNVSEDHHFEGNFVGNTWIITPDDIPENMRGQQEFYAVILYQKQIGYTITLIISGFTIFILLLLAVIQESREFFKKRRHLAKQENTI